MPSRTAERFERLSRQKTRPNGPRIMERVKKNENERWNEARKVSQQYRPVPRDLAMHVYRKKGDKIEHTRWRRREVGCLPSGNGVWRLMLAQTCVPNLEEASRGGLTGRFQFHFFPLRLVAIESSLSAVSNRSTVVSALLFASSHHRASIQLNRRFFHRAWYTGGE